MADLFAAKDASGATVEILTDEVTDGTLGTGQKQLIGIVDATINGTNKLIVDSSGRAKVDASGAAVPVTDNSGSLTVDDGGLTISVDDGAGSLTVDGSVSLAAAIPAGTNVIGHVVVDSGAVTADTELTTADLDTGAGTDTRAVVGIARAESGGAVLVGSANPLPVSSTDLTTLAGAVTSAKVQTDVLTMPSADVSTDTIGSAPFAEVSLAGATPQKWNSAASTNATSVKASTGKVYSIVVTNQNAATRYLKFYNKASAPTVGTDTPVWVLAVPGNSTGAGMVVALPMPLKFSTGIAFAITTGAADSDTGAVALNEIIVNLGYA